MGIYKDKALKWKGVRQRLFFVMDNFLKKECINVWTDQKKFEQILFEMKRDK